MRLRRNPAWFARDDSPRGIGTGRPFLDGYDAFFSPQEDAFQRAAFQRALVDATGFVDPAALDDERKTNLADIALDETGAGGILASRFLLDRRPFNDDRVRRAIHLAIDRAALIELLYPAMDGRPSARAHRPDRAGDATAGPSRATISRGGRVPHRTLPAARRTSARRSSSGTPRPAARSTELRITFAGGRERSRTRDRRHQRQLAERAGREGRRRRRTRPGRRSSRRRCCATSRARRTAWRRSRSRSRTAASTWTTGCTRSSAAASR